MRKILNQHILLLIVLSVVSCNKEEFRYDTWDYIQQGKRVKVTDTINFDNKEFKNPYLSDILFIDSIISSLPYEDNEMKIEERGGIQFLKSKTVTINTGKMSYSLFRGDIYDKIGLKSNQPFIYWVDHGTVSFYVYGHGWVNLISRVENNVNITVDSTLYFLIEDSEELFPPPPQFDSLKVFDIKIGN